MTAPDSDNDGTITGINVTPMVDVMLVLLIIFMVTTHFVSDSGLKVNLPRAAASEASPDRSLTVSLDELGRLFLMKEEVDLNGLKANLTREANLNTGLRVTIAADGRIPYQQVVTVLDAVKQSGVTKVALASEPGSGP